MSERERESAREQEQNYILYANWFEQSGEESKHHKEERKQKSNRIELKPLENEFVEMRKKNKRINGIPRVLFIKFRC